MINPQSSYTRIELLLLFLKSYTRVSKPNHVDIELWNAAFPDNKTIDQLSEFRLAYTQNLLSQEVWTIIKSELNLKTYKLWIDSVHIFEPYLNKDDICVYAVKEIVRVQIFWQSIKYYLFLGFQWYFRYF